MTPRNYIVKKKKKIWKEHHKNVIYFEEYYNSILKCNPLIDGFYLNKSCVKNSKAEDKRHFKIKLQQSSETNNSKLVTLWFLLCSKEEVKRKSVSLWNAS